MIFSHSQLETYENCPQKYRLQYIERLKTPRKSIEAFTGSLVHESLESLYRDVLMGRRLSLEDLERRYLARWRDLCSSDVFMARSEYSREDYRSMGLKCLRDYYHRYHPFTGVVPVWLEQRVRMSIPDACGNSVDFMGIIDRLDSLEGGRYEIHDYKTAMSLPTQEKIEADRQLTLYQKAVQEAFADAEGVELVWHYLVFDREVRLRRQPQEVEKVSREAAMLAREIEAAEDFPARESNLCAWCELQEHCSKRKHIYMAAQPGVSQLGTERGVQLADEYREWTMKKREAEQHLKELRAESLDFCAYYGAENLKGSACTLKVARQKALKIPEAGSAAREDLERLLREEAAWDRVSLLNPRMLGAALERGEFDERLSERLKPLVRWEQSATLRILED
jgi:putative RecB family exonuclease